MTIVPIVADAWEQMKPLGPPKKRVRLCQYDRAFCVDCPSADILPCVLAGGYWDCVTCVESDCACMVLPTSRRRDAYQNWRVELNRKNGVTVKQGGKCWGNYRSGRKCSVCGTSITDKGKTGKCLTCAMRSRS